MSRKKIEQDVYFKSFRYTDKQLYLNEFLNELENKNRFIVTLILGSKRYSSYLKKMKDLYKNTSLGYCDGF